MSLANRRYRQLNSSSPCAAPSGNRYRSVAALWALRALVPLSGAHRLAFGYIHNVQELLVEIGCWPLESPVQDGPMIGPAAMKRLHALHSDAERRAATLPEPLASNVSRLGKLVGLNAAEETIVGFAVLLYAVEWLEPATDALGNVDAAGLHKALAVLLKIETGKMRRALSPEGRLYEAGLVRVCARNGRTLKDKLELLSGLEDCLLIPQQDPAAALRDYFQLAAPAKLGLESFSHVDRDLEVILPHLKHAVDRRPVGVNLLIHGRSGVGKTELVRTLAKSLDVHLYEIGSAGADGNPHNGLYRLQACQLCQRVLSRRGRCMVLFDEIEDVFPSPRAFFAEGNGQTGPKAWINRLLEQNPVPAFWLSNRIGHIDSAYLRRFDYVLRLRPPARERRAAFIRECLDGLPVNERTVARLADNEHLVPALTERAAKVARASADAAPAQIDRAFARAVENSLTAIGARTNSAFSAPTSIPYDLSLTNADHDLAEIVDGLRRTGGGRLCLYGPPGTGKTCYAWHIARSLDRPMHAKRASDILSAWVGDAEKNIRQMFRDAADEGALLLLDEADSFLQDRRTARRSWEITQVNELLVQMEQFDGIFVASTNLFEGLDGAALRRKDTFWIFDTRTGDERFRSDAEALVVGGRDDKGIEAPFNIAEKSDAW